MTNYAYLTIDDSPSTGFLEKLAFLESYGIKAMWFCQGDCMEQRPDMMVNALQAGHIVANHAYSHPYFSGLTLEQCFVEIYSTHTILEKLHTQAGVAWDKKYFRFPFGDDGGGTAVMERALQNVLPKTPARAIAIQKYLKKLGYVQADFEGIKHPFFLDYSQNYVDVFVTYDSQDWQLGHDKTEDGEMMINSLLARMDADEPENLANLNVIDSNTVLGFHDHATHPQNFSLFKQMVLKVLKKGFVFTLPQ